MNPTQRSLKARMALVLATAMSVGVAGCVSLGAEIPESLLTLTPTSFAPIGTGAAASAEDAGDAVAVLTPEVPAKLDVVRVPVTVSDTQIAYLPEAIWVEKPARLFRRLLGETLRAKGDAFIIDNDDTPLRAGTFLRGTLTEMGYDAPTSSVVVRYDAVRTDGQGNATTRRFEARESGIIADPELVGGALNRAANRVAAEVADWMVE
ncbi:MAG: ABC-type transport auxiliary lipoprotein family protein [Erythrobacter sp.]